MKKITLLFLLLLAGTFGFAQGPTDNATDPPVRDAADVMDFKGSIRLVPNSLMMPST